jgi:site-specific DNA-methyltransferase (adenine-specific)
MNRVILNKLSSEKMREDKTSAVVIADTNGASPYSEKWSMHPGGALRLKRGLSAKEQQSRAKHPVMLSQDIFQSRSLQRKAFYADKDCLIFCGEVREVVGWLREAGVFADSVITSPPFYGQRDYGVAGQIGLEQKPEEFVSRLVDVFGDIREVLQTTGSVWVNLGDTYWNGRGEHRGKDIKQQARRFGLRPQDRRGDGKLCKNKQLLLIPHRFAIAMQEKDWIVRNDNVWVKPNPIPNKKFSVISRPCNFRLGKNWRN